MPPFDSLLGAGESRDPVRPDLVEAYRATWEHIAKPGTWLTGALRVAVADETRCARACGLCADRKAALSPFAVQGEHDMGLGAETLAPALVDAVHRVTTDAARLGESWYRGLLEEGTTDDEYVEALGVAVCVISIDRFHEALGRPLEPLPEPVPGEPSRERPTSLVEGEAWVPIQDSKSVSKLLELPAPVAPYVLRALSLVPAEVMAWQRLSGAQYLGPDAMLRFDSPRAITRSQIELVAGRVSALNECFY